MSIVPKSMCQPSSCRGVLVWVSSKFLISRASALAAYAFANDGGCRRGIPDRSRLPGSKSVKLLSASGVRGRGLILSYHISSPFIDVTVINIQVLGGTEGEARRPRVAPLALWSVDLIHLVVRVEEFGVLMVVVIVTEVALQS